MAPSNASATSAERSISSNCAAAIAGSGLKNSKDIMLAAHIAAQHVHHPNQGPENRRDLPDDHLAEQQDGDGQRAVQEQFDFIRSARAINFRGFLEPGAQVFAA